MGVLPRTMWKQESFVVLRPSWSRWISTSAVDYDIACLWVAPQAILAMRTYDLLMLLVLAVWWLRFRKKYDWRAVVLFYLGGVMIADVFCAGLILLLYRRHPEILTTPALLMPIGGMIGLGYGATKNKLSKGTALFKN